MTTSAIEHEALMRGGMNTGIRPTFGYYRQPNGWITVSPSTDMDELKYRREGWEPLHRYGYFDMASEYAADHPLETLFMFGGAHELPVEQIVQQGLYIDPPLVPVCRQALTQRHKHHTAACWAGARSVYFPQLEGVEVLGPFACRFCGVEKPTTLARDQHEGVAHKEEKGDIRTGETLAAALVKGLQGYGAPHGEHAASADVLAALQLVGLTEEQVEALKTLGIDAGKKPRGR